MTLLDLDSQVLLFKTKKKRNNVNYWDYEEAIMTLVFEIIYFLNYQK